MGAENYLRPVHVHIDEVCRTAKSTVQWFAERKNEKGKATHPISHNNALSLYVCGEEAFRAIAKDIAAAKKSIDLICWGFDPGMELERQGSSWPRGETYGDLLIAAGKRGVQVRLLVWYSISGGKVQKHMPGHTHGTNTWRPVDSDREIYHLHSRHSLDRMREHARLKRHKDEWHVSGDTLAARAREEYCYSWYEAAFNGKLKGISIRKRDGDRASITKALSRESRKPDGLEEQGFKLAGTHHQKPILIDFAHESGRKAIGYVMGLNSVTSYWDTVKHEVENPLREQRGEKTKKETAQGIEGEFNFKTLKPYRDYASRIEGGFSLVSLHENFERAWSRAGDAAAGKSYVCTNPPQALLRKPGSGHSTVQIVRTQPEEDDFTIKDIYFNATRVAAAGGGYLYMENQYFQYQDWAEHLLAKRKQVIAAWNRGCGKIGKTSEDLPLLYVFVVIPAPEMAGMIPRTYDTLATLGQHEGMTAQEAMIDRANTGSPVRVDYSPGSVFPFDISVEPYVFQPLAKDVISAANKIEKPSTLMLKNKYGLRVCVAMLNSCDFDKARRQWRYREIYIHSKLLIVNDSFLTLGSANLNQRSMAVDSELNLATNDPSHATALRRRVWSQIATAELCGGNGTEQEIKETFVEWLALMDDNKRKQKAQSTDPKKTHMIGLIVPLDDGRSSTMRIG